MEQKSVKIQVPEGYEIDKENSTFEEIKFKLIKEQLTYKDVASKLFHKNAYWTTQDGTIYSGNCMLSMKDPNNCTSYKQAEKLLAMNMLMNVAKYLNDGWEPDWNNGSEDKWQINVIGGILNYGIVRTIADMSILFKIKELAKQAVEILGEDVIRLAFCTDY